MVAVIVLFISQVEVWDHVCLFCLFRILVILEKCLFLIQGHTTHNNYVAAVIILFISQVEVWDHVCLKLPKRLVGTPLLKDIIIPTVKQEVGQMLQDIASGVGVKSALKRGAKRAGKSPMRKATNRIMNGKGQKRKRKQNPNTALSALLKGINSAKRRR